MGIPFPEEYGGGGGDTLSYALAIEELARIDASVCITVAAHTSLGTMPIYLWGTEEQKRDWLPQLTAGERLAAFGLTEPEAGSDAGNVRTTARLEIGEGYRKMGWNASDTRPLSFDDARVPEGNLLGPRGDGFKQFLHILDGGRIGVAAMGVGMAQGALDEALKYAKERRAFGQPISKFQAIQAKIADISSEIEAARLLTYKAALEKDHGKSFTLTAAQAKLKTGRL